MARPNYPENTIVNLDMDGVLFNFVGAIDRKLQQEFPSMELADPASHFYVFKRYSDPAVVQFIKDTQNSQGFFANLEMIDGALAAWQTMQELGYHPRINSAPLTDNPYCIQEKLSVVDRYFGAQAADEAFVGKDKASEPGIALIDDRPGLQDGKTWKRVVFSQPYNRADSDLRLENWADPALPQILAYCAARYDSLNPGE